ncbi:hypothetical protein AKG11_24050 [Shinella sp. SUS2]|jgi:uncharacterized protein YqeY|nr:hypothetical protein AKG11_24050 [Shinella sp. SUS2]KOC72005.1 hypothetical protein AKG10_29795 [Shinella sp. GWS1]
MVIQPQGNVDKASDAAGEMKARMRGDLRAAIKEGRPDEAKLIRTLVAAIDNAEAPPLQPGHRAADHHSFCDGSAEVERLSLSAAQVRAILLADIAERERAAAEMDRHQRPDRADALRAEARLAKRYIVE